jgi:hypothetical protein
MIGIKATKKPKTAKKDLKKERIEDKKIDSMVIKGLHFILDGK